MTEETAKRTDKRDPNAGERLRDILTGAWAVAVLEDDRFSEIDRFPMITEALRIAVTLADGL